MSFGHSFLDIIEIKGIKFMNILEIVGILFFYVACLGWAIFVFAMISSVFFIVLWLLFNIDTLGYVESKYDQWKSKKDFK